MKDRKWFMVNQEMWDVGLWGMEKKRRDMKGLTHIHSWNILSTKMLILCVAEIGESFWSTGKCGMLGCILREK
jgi:hypothetical protein